MALTPSGRARPAPPARLACPSWHSAAPTNARSQEMTSPSRFCAAEWRRGLSRVRSRCAPRRGWRSPKEPASATAWHRIWHSLPSDSWQAPRPEDVGLRFAISVLVRLVPRRSVVATRIRPPSDASDQSEISARTADRRWLITPWDPMHETKQPMVGHFPGLGTLPLGPLSVPPVTAKPATPNSPQGT